MDGGGERDGDGGGRGWGLEEACWKLTSRRPLAVSSPRGLQALARNEEEKTPDGLARNVCCSLLFSRRRPIFTEKSSPRESASGLQERRLKASAFTPRLDICSLKRCTGVYRYRHQTGLSEIAPDSSCVS